MKLYSRNQVSLFLFLTAMFAVCLGIFSDRYIFSTEVTKTAEHNATETTTQTTYTDDATHYQQLEAHAVSLASQKYTQDEKQNISVYEKTNEAVVNITTETVSFNMFFDAIPTEGASGSGSIIDKKGFVLTNTHVISDASKIFVSLADGSQHEAAVIGVDKENDLAVLKFTPPKHMILKTIPFGDSRNLRVGQKVLAIGNPFGFDRTLTVGIVSALERPIKSSSNTIIKNMIQTDTAINPGNSGGPLLDTTGKMIGINTMIYSTSGSSAGVGFAVPINTARRIVADLIKYGRVRRGQIDAQLIQLNASLATKLEATSDKGLLVISVKKGSNSEKSGLRGGTKKMKFMTRRGVVTIFLGGDIITAINNTPVRTLAEYYTVLEDKKPGEKISVTILRREREKKLSITLSERDK